MEREPFLRQLDELLELDPGTLKGPERLESLDAWNSLAVIGFMSLANEHYGVIVSPKDIAASKTVDDLLALTR